MIAWAFAVAACLSLPTDAARKYFAGLQRPGYERVDVQRDGGPVILIVVDAMRPDRLTPYGARRDTTPNLARLADEGVVLTNYFVNGNWTRPSTATMLTGLLPGQHGVERERDKLADEFVTLAEVLDRGKVATGAVVGNGNAGSAFGLGRGFRYYADTTQHWRGLPSAEQVTELATPFVRSHAHEPFFLMLFFVDAHDPYHAPPPYDAMFVKDPRVPLIRSPLWEARRYSRAQVERMQATYDGALRYTDATLGTFFQALKNMGVYDKATFIVTADHGEAFGEHGEFLHSHHLYDELIRAPLIVRSPKMSVRGGAHDGLFQTIDLLPTLTSYFGVASQKDLPGKDIFAQLRGAKESPRVVVSEFNNFGIHRRAARSRQLKVVHEAPANAAEFEASVGARSRLPSVAFNTERFMAFDLGADPFERRNVYTPQLVKDDAWAPLFAALAASEKASGGARPSVAEHIDSETYRDLKSLGYVQ